jgi:ribosome-interacting GTPase 1
MMGAYRSADIIAIVVDLAAVDALEQLEACLEVLTNRGVLPVGRRVGREERDEEGRQLKTALILATKADLPGAADTFDALKELYGERLPMFAVSSTTRQNLDAFVAHLFTTLDVIRVYCKQPGKPADTGAPFILPRGSSVVDMARAVHREFPDKLKYACVWGSAKFDGQQVQRDHVLQDRDIVELHVVS